MPPCQGWVARPFPSFLKPLFQSKAKCKQSKWYENDFSFWWRWNLLSHKGFALSLVLKVTVFETWKCPIEQWAHELHCGIPVEQNNPGYLKEFLVNYCLFSRIIIKHDNVLLQFTTVQLITIYDSLVITIYDNFYYNLLQFTWLLQFMTTVITIYDDCFYNLRRLLFQFTTAITIHDRADSWEVKFSVFFGDVLHYVASKAFQKALE